MEDLQGLLEKINREGVEKAEATAAKIVAEATAKAESLVRNARAEADKAKADAEKAAEDFMSRAKETVRQAARDTVIMVESSVKSLLEKLLLKETEKALADENTAAKLVAAAIGEMSGPGEIVCGPALAKALAADLASLGSFTVTTDESAGAGFSVKVDGGRVESAFTADVVAGELAKRLRPDLAALLK